MSRKEVFVIMLAVLLVGLFTVTFGLRSVELEQEAWTVNNARFEYLEAPEAEAVSSSSSVDWWPMFRHDMSHTGHSTSTVPNTCDVSWSYTTGDSVYSSPAVADGKVYVGSSWPDDKVYFLNATLNAVDLRLS